MASRTFPTREAFIPHSVRKWVPLLSGLRWRGTAEPPGMLEKTLKQRGKACGPCSGGTPSPQVSLFDLETTGDSESQTGQRDAMWEPGVFATWLVKDCHLRRTAGITAALCVQLTSQSQDLHLFCRAGLSLKVSANVHRPRNECSVLEEYPDTLDRTGEHQEGNLNDSLHHEQTCPYRSSVGLGVVLISIKARFLNFLRNSWQPRSYPLGA